MITLDWSLQSFGSEPTNPLPGQMLDLIGPVLVSELWAILLCKPALPDVQHHPDPPVELARSLKSATVTMPSSKLGLCSLWNSSLLTVLRIQVEMYQIITGDTLGHD